MEPEASADVGNRRRDPARTGFRLLGLTSSQSVSLALRAFGYACLIMALLVGGYLGWLWWGTGWVNARAQHQLRHEIDQRISAAIHHQGGPDTPGTISRPILPGDAVAILRIDKIHVDAVVVEGTEGQNLEKGPGHYRGTAYPWQATGRVAIAGHRTTYGRPFWSLDRLVKGDSISLVTEFGWFRYVVSRTQVILPTSTWVLAQTRKPTLVLTTCTPRFSASNRLAVFADRVEGRWFQTGPTGHS